MGGLIKSPIEILHFSYSRWMEKGPKSFKAPDIDRQQIWYHGDLNEICCRWAQNVDPSSTLEEFESPTNDKMSTATATTSSTTTTNNNNNSNSNKNPKESLKQQTPHKPKLSGAQKVFVFLCSDTLTDALH